MKIQHLKLWVLIFLTCILQSMQAQQLGSGQGQNTGIGKISGRVVDSASQKPLEFVNVVLRDALEHQDLDGILTDQSGKFEFVNLLNKKYEIAFVLLGYKSKVVGPIKVNKETPDHNFGKIILEDEVKRLDEVTIAGTKDIVENKIDRLIYNAEKDVTTKGGDAADVLRRTPMLTVDLEGNVSLQGSQNVKILINGKPSSIMAGNVGDALKMIPADMIEKVEVITQPGAKYDAEGSGGIVNIVTKTKKIIGVSGSVNGSIGTRSNFLGSNISMRFGKWGLTGNLGGHMWRSKSESKIVREYFVPAEYQVLNQTGSGSNLGGGTFIQIGADYDFNDKNNVSLSLRTPIHAFGNKNKLSYYGGDQIDSLDWLYRRESSVNNLNLGSDVNIDYKRTFKKDSPREWGISGQYNYNNRKTKYITSQFDELSALEYKELGPNSGINAEATIATDYLHPITSKINVELGAKSIWRDVKSDIYYDTLQISNDIYQRDQSRSNLFIYHQDVAAAYTQITFPITKKIQARTGLRYENTSISGNQNNESEFKRNYSSWIPSGLISFTLPDKSTLKASYSRRIQRPSMFYLNPYINYNDPTNISYGNPNLKPELTESFELSYAFSKNFKNINATLYHKVTSDLIDNYRFIDSLGRINSTYNNDASGYSSGLSLTGGIVRIGKIILNSTINLYYQKLTSDQYASVKNDAFNFNVNAFGNIYFTKKWGFTIFGFYNSPKLTTQGKQANYFVYSLGFRKDLWDKKGGISFGVDNPFHPKMKLYSYFESPQFKYDQKNDLEGWGVRISMDYRFGKMEFGGPQKKRKDSINDDLKQGEGENSGGGGGGNR